MTCLLTCVCIFVFENLNDFIEESLKKINGVLSITTTDDSLIGELSAAIQAHRLLCICMLCCWVSLQRHTAWRIYQIRESEQIQGKNDHKFCLSFSFVILNLQMYFCKIDN